MSASKSPKLENGIRKRKRTSSSSEALENGNISKKSRQLVSIEVIFGYVGVLRSRSFTQLEIQQ